MRRQGIFYIGHKIRVGVFSSLILGAFLIGVGYLRVLFGADDGAFGPPWGFGLMSQLYAFPAFVLGGAPCSMLIDASLLRVTFHSKLWNYLTHFAVYVVVGFLLILAIKWGLSIQSGTTVVIKSTPVADTFRNLEAGGCPALLYYHVEIVLNWLKMRKSDAQS